MDHEGQTSLQRQISRNEFQKGRPWEYSFKAYLKPTIHDKLTSIDVEVSYELASSGGGRGKKGFSNLKNVIVIALSIISLDNLIIYSNYISFV